MGDLDPELFGKDQPCFGCSPTHPIGLRLRFSVEDGVVSTRFTPGERHQGPPGIMHGGLVTTLADELAAWTLIGVLGKFGFTASMALKLLRPVRIRVELVGRGRIEKQSPRVVRVAVAIEQAGEEAFTGEFAFAMLDRGAAEKMLGGPLPEAWRRFSR